MKTSHSSKKSGFTLVELLVVIAIIAILTGIIITGLVGSRAKARDAQRASDLSQISLAIEQYFDRCDQYPPSNPSIFTTALTSITAGCPISPSQVSLANFISRMPTDPSGPGAPLGNNGAYGYSVNTTDTDYVLYTKFETTNSVLSQSAPNPSWYKSPENGGASGNFDCGNQATTPIVTNGLDYCVRPD